MTQKPVMLLILDGWGYRQPVTPDNAIENGHTPNWHSYLKEYPHSLIETYGLAVGLPEGQMGNSEVGHMNFGCRTRRHAGLAQNRPGNQRRQH